MPYMQERWARFIREKKGPAAKEGNTNRRLRTIPFEKGGKCCLEETASLIEREKEPPSIEFNKLLALKDSIKKEIDVMYRNKPALPTENKCFFKYSLQPDEVVFNGKFSNIYLSHHESQPECKLAGRVFEPTARIEIHKSMFLKILKHVGKRHNFIIGTWDIFFDPNGRLVVFQEYAPHGNLLEYLKAGSVFVTEVQLAEWAHNIYNALDFLGDIGVCHRSISPKHILLSGNEQSESIIAKLASFRDAVVYFDARLCRVRNQPCKPVDRRNVGNFQPPEVYGVSGEEFDPIMADVWSYGASMYYAACRNYPYNYRDHSIKDIGAAIEKTLEMNKTLSLDAKSWFSGLLKAESKRRTPFDKITEDPWFSPSSNQSIENTENTEAEGEINEAAGAGE